MPRREQGLTPGGRENAHAVEAHIDAAVLLQLLLCHTVQEVAVDATSHQVVRVLAELGVNAAQPVSQVTAIAGGVICICLQLCQLPEKPGKSTDVSTRGFDGARGKAGTREEKSSQMLW